MTKPDFSQMSRSELREYLIHHRNDTEAWGEFISRPKPNSKRYPPPLNQEGMQIAEQVFREKLGLPDEEQTT
jgi:hypothetical protein